MEQITTKENLKLISGSWKAQGKSIGFVPTMGALHKGHISLIRQSRLENDVTAVSIFVNPLQFNNPTDLEKYPRTIESDVEMLRNESVDLVFIPSESEFYSQPSATSFDFGSVSAGLEGAMRPGHFSGVGVVVARLFHLFVPTRAYFGSKDLQQVAVIKTMVRDLAFDLEIVRCETFREPSGLAMSSRNQRLSQSGREIASHLSKALQIGVSKWSSGLVLAKEKASQYLQPFEIEIEYLEWVQADTMQPIEDQSTARGEVALCAAVWVEGVRLIDNLIIKV